VTPREVTESSAGRLLRTATRARSRPRVAVLSGRTGLFASPDPAPNPFKQALKDHPGAGDAAPSSSSHAQKARTTASRERLSGTTHA
jgi:hypothetical protein